MFRYFMQFISRILPIRVMTRTTYPTCLGSLALLDTPNSSNFGNGATTTRTCDDWSAHNTKYTSRRRTAAGFRGAHFSLQGLLRMQLRAAEAAWPLFPTSEFSRIPDPTVCPVRLSVSKAEMGLIQCHVGILPRSSGARVRNVAVHKRSGDDVYPAQAVQARYVGLAPLFFVFFPCPVQHPSMLGRLY